MNFLFRDRINNNINIIKILYAYKNVMLYLMWVSVLIHVHIQNIVHILKSQFRYILYTKS